MVCVCQDTEWWILEIVVVVFVASVEGGRGTRGLGGLPDLFPDDLAVLEGPAADSDNLTVGVAFVAVALGAAGVAGEATRGEGQGVGLVAVESVQESRLVALEYGLFAVASDLDDCAGVAVCPEAERGALADLGGFVACPEVAEFVLVNDLGVIRSSFDGVDFPGAGRPSCPAVDLPLAPRGVFFAGDDQTGLDACLGDGCHDDLPLTPTT